MTIITNNNGQTYQTAGTGTTIGAVLAGGLANNAIINLNARAVSPQIMKKFGKQSSELNETQVAEMQKGIKDAFEKSGLKQKGVEILDVREMKDENELTPASKKLEGEEPKNNFDKVTTFIKNNVGKLAVLSFIPLVAEELAASYKGEKLAKQVLSPELLKKVENCNRLGASTYILMASAVGLGAVVASKVRDAIAKPEEI